MVLKAKIYKWLGFDKVLEGITEAARAEYYLKIELYLAQQYIEELESTIDRLIEPPDGINGCYKIRFRSRDEAWVFIKQLAKKNGISNPEEVYRVYRCKLCPRQPVDSVSRFFHFTHQDREQRRLKGRQYSKYVKSKNPQKIDPAQLKKVLDKINGN